MIKGKTPEEIRKTFNIKNDFSAEEEEEVRRENQWAFEWKKPCFIIWVYVILFSFATDCMVLGWLQCHNCVFQDTSCYSPSIQGSPPSPTSNYFWYSVPFVAYALLSWLVCLLQSLFTTVWWCPVFALFLGLRCYEYGLALAVMHAIRPLDIARINSFLLLSPYFQVLKLLKWWSSAGISSNQKQHGIFRMMNLPYLLHAITSLRAEVTTQNLRFPWKYVWLRNPNFLKMVSWFQASNFLAMSMTNAER